MKSGEEVLQRKLEKEHKLRIGVVILSRFSSSRLPGKALMKIRGKVVLEYILERLRTVFDISEIVLATSVEISDDPISIFAKNYGVSLYRGSLENVASRFYGAAEREQWDYAIRINGDNIFVDTDVLNDMLSIAKTNQFDFISNVKERTFPKGMSVEIVKVSHYKDSLKYIDESESYKEHVMSYFYEREGAYTFYENTSLPEASGIQLALDTPEDFQRTEKIIKNFTKDHVYYNLKEIFEIYKLVIE